MRYQPEFSTVSKARCLAAATADPDPLSKAPQESLATSGRAIVVESAINGGIDHVAQERSIMAPLFRRRRLQHEQNKQVPRRVHPEVCSGSIPCAGGKSRPMISVGNRYPA
jgi:hypothetical protein